MRTGLLTGLFSSLAVLVGVDVADEKPSEKKMRPYVTITGAHCKVTEPSYKRVVDANEWARLWLRHKGKESTTDYDYFYNPAGVPIVNFEACMVVAIFEGSGWNSAGLWADSLVEQDNAVVLRFDHKSYQTGEKGDGVTVFGFFVIPRSAKPIVLEENVQSRIGRPPQWKEIARLGG